VLPLGLNGGGTTDGSIKYAHFISCASRQQMPHSPSRSSQYQSDVIRVQQALTIGRCPQDPSHSRYPVDRCPPRPRVRRCYHPMRPLDHQTAPQRQIWGQRYSTLHRRAWMSKRSRQPRWPCHARPQTHAHPALQQLSARLTTPSCSRR
jgi:hypothetical protein